MLKPLDAEAFVPELAAEAFVRSVLPRLTPIHEHGLNALDAARRSGRALTNSGPLAR